MTSKKRSDELISAALDQIIPHLVIELDKEIKQLGEKDFIIKYRLGDVENGKQDKSKSKIKIIT